MAIQIINCPSCDTFVLEDTAECPECGHVIHAVRAKEVQRRVLPTDAAVDDDMEACPKCGETCRQGLVRCWNCGSFLRPEIEAEFLRRRNAAPLAAIETFDLEVIEEASLTEADSLRRRNLSTPESFLAAPVAYEDDSDGDDFELSEDVHMSDADEDDFDLGATVQMHMNDGPSAEDDAPTFRLQQPAEAPALSPAAASETDSELDRAATTIPLIASVAASGAVPAAEAIPSLDAGPSADGAKDEKKSTDDEDELLKIASAEEVEVRKARKASVAGATFVVYCPQGHRIRVREKFRGKTGKCPKCESAFVVPLKQKPNARKKTDPEAAAVGGATGAATSGRYPVWLQDVRLHAVVPEKLKLKADSLLNEFTAVDVGLSGNDILIANLVASAGFMGANLKKKPAIRVAMQEHLAKADATLDGLAIGSWRVVSKDNFSQVILVQPTPIGTELLFGDIPVFGTGRIAVRLPKGLEEIKPDDKKGAAKKADAKKNDDDKVTLYLSFALSEFRTFATGLQSACGIEGFGSNSEIPMTDHFESFKCHYTDTQVQDLANIDYYRKDPAFKIETGGWKCAGCGLVVSEDGRKKEKLGGLNGKGLAKAKCPKCTRPFGNNPLVHLAAVTSGATAATTPAPAEAAPAAS